MFKKIYKQKNLTSLSTLKDFLCLHTFLKKILIEKIKCLLCKHDNSFQELVKILNQDQWPYWKTSN